MTAYYDPSKIGVQESLAEMTAIELLQSLVRNGFDCVKETYSLVDALSQRKLEVIKAKYQHVLMFKGKTEESRSAILQYLVRTTPTLTHKDSFRNIAYNIERVSQLMSGLANRLAIMANNNVEVPQELTEKLKDFSKRFLEEYDAMRQGIMMLNINPKVTVEYAKNAIKIEDELDERYRLFTFTLYEKYSSNIMLVLFLKEIIDIVEDSADLVKEAAEELMYLAMHKIS
ncbi:MAG: hypothetical protein B6U75_00500 [Desulfurococcales archaeon ex4484_217_1]|nr:MAG: hypothetical protein B6U75_00500 [Desulfurococcales archaeon ex4484_217_1]